MSQPGLYCSFVVYGTVWDGRGSGSSSSPASAQRVSCESLPPQGVPSWCGQTSFLQSVHLPHIKVSYKAVEVSLKVLVWVFFRPQEINKEELEGNSMRCGRKLAKDGDVSVARGTLQGWHG